MFYRSERLLLRPAWPEDWRSVHAGIADEGVVRNLARAPWPYAEQDARDFCARDIPQHTPRFLITLAATAEVVGAVGYGPSDQEDDIELGYWIARAHWGRGYATEAAMGAIEIAQMAGQRCLSAGHFVDNPASGKVLRKVGFVPTGRVAQRHSLGRGGEAPCVLYRLDLGADPCLTDKAA